MAYADYKFYTESFGSVVPEADFPRLAERASDFIDLITHGRLVNGLPTNEYFQKRIKKAVCSLAEILYQIELAEKNAANAAASGTSTTIGTGGSTTGIVTSVSSGSESISYALLSRLEQAQRNGVRCMPPPEMYRKPTFYFKVKLRSFSQE